MHQGLPGSARSDIRLLFTAVVKLHTNISTATALQCVLSAQSLSKELEESLLPRLKPEAHTLCMQSWGMLARSKICLCSRLSLKAAANAFP